MDATLRQRLSRIKRTTKTWLRSTVDAVQTRRDLADVEAFVLFIGYPRSGHSLVGSLLDAHPEVVIAHELDALKYLRKGFRRQQIWALVLENAARFTAKGRQTNHEYSYAVPGQWQGRWQRLRVVGDKKGRNTTMQLRAEPALLDRLRTRMQVPIRVIHVVRNPYDNIATMLSRGEPDLASAIRAYADLCETNEDLRRRLTADELFELRHEALLAEPAPVLRGLVEHLGLQVPDRYVEDCAGILFDSPKRTRTAAPWTPALEAEVAALIERHEFLAGYTFEV